MSLIDIVKHALPMKLADGKRHVWPTLASMVYLKDGTTPLADEDGKITADDAMRLGGKSPEYYLQHRNLLDNSDWRIKANIVNRKNVTIVEPYKDCIDCWGVEGSGTLEVLDDSLQLTVEEGAAYVGFNQNLENYSLMKGKTYTFAFNADGVVRFVPFVMGGSAGGHTNGDFKIYSVDGLNMLIRFHGQSTKLYWAALYEGHLTAETLPPYVPKGYANELLACEVAEKGNIFGMDLLWENATPASKFLEQTVAVDFTQYDVIKIYWALSIGSNAYACAERPATAGRLIMQFVNVPDTGLTRNHRYATLAEDKKSIHFGIDIEGNTNAAGIYIIPVLIYGIKGVGA